MDRTREYAALLSRFPALEAVVPSAGRGERMRQVCDAAWDTIGSRDVSWLGFYTKVDGRDEMVLGPRRDKPACSPIHLGGMCGRSWQERRPILIHDTAALEGGYIACDPKDRSEAVIPLFDERGGCYGVFDLDSYGIGAFNSVDIAALTDLVERVGLSSPGHAGPTLSL
jgi:putative methionine-R-sulfoxide reductase with GAF domain